MRKMMKKAIALLAVIFLASIVSAGNPRYLGPMINLVIALIEVFRTLGYSLAVIMFIYGGAKYAYTADDPGGRKQALGIMVASILAVVIIQIATVLICTISVTGNDPGHHYYCPT